MEKIFNYSLEKKAPITEEEVIALGWIKEEGKKYFKKDNYWLVFVEKNGHKRMSIIAEDPLKVEWYPDSPEQFRVVVKHPTLEAFKIITAFI